MADEFKLTYGVDLKSFERQLTAIQRQALPAAQAGYLNALAFGARKNLQTAFDKEIAGGPVAFTKRGVVVDKAGTTSGKPEAAVKLLPEQAWYLQYPLLGGVRRAGDPGASRWDVLTGAAETNSFGNIKKGYIRRVAKKAKTEKERRAALRQKRDELRAAGKSTGKAKWATGTRAPGIFFAEVRHAKGYWQRPSTPGGKLTLLARFSTNAKYKSSIHWDAAIQRAVFINDPKGVFDAELRRALSKLPK
ncbi:hypothetical protein E0H39_29775 [Rhizobium leguminosarum bv. viciae]|uniref:hypothetical protein n=1 Tax=Rhizobium leguminosarum TaxID=384 RepID=UPI00103C9CA7|nr:hypothetical protein [Rhizobium leguminosarum]TBY57697.1 hypothetical protein E0H39_29775 [Rhizobium leguminosarum bv. viciae]